MFRGAYTVKLIVGLGNPGSAYRGTRHNVGFDVVDEVARRWNLGFQSAPADAVLARSHGTSSGGPPAILLKPLTYMNRSGFAVGAVQRYYGIELSDLLVVTEDVNMPLGRLRARRQGSAGGHNGLRSITEELGTEQFSRARLGVGRGDPRQGLASRVLSRFEADERSVVDEAVGRAAEAVALFTESGIDSVMNRFNRQDPDERPGEGTDNTDDDDNGTGSHREPSDL